MTNQLRIFSIIIIGKYMYLPSWLVLAYSGEANLTLTFSIISLYYVYEYSRSNNFHLVTIALHLVRVDTLRILLHGRAEIQNFSSHVEKYFMSERSK